MAGRSVLAMAALPAVLALVALAACSDSGPDSVATTAPTTAAAAPAVSAPGTTAGTTASATAPAPTPSPPPTAAPTTAGGVAPTGFDTVAGRVTAADGSTCDVCLWAALTEDQHTRGLMGVTDLSGADGMVFHFGGETTAAFWMLDTPTPLSVAFFGKNGAFVSSLDMAPCVDMPAVDCARYAAAAPYTDAVEVAQGKLPSLLMTPGSRLEVFDKPCPLEH